MNEALFSFNNASEYYNDYAAHKKAKKGSLQWLFTDLVEGNEIRRYSDKRAAGVTNDNNNKKLETKNTTVGTGKNRLASTGGQHDGLLGSLLLESFSAAAVCELLPSFLTMFDVALAIECIDEFWVERSQANAANKQPEPTYFPL